MPTSITFTGWNEFRSKVKNLPVVLFEELDGECEDAAGYWEELAKRAAPRDAGRLSQNISSVKVSMMHHEVVDPVEYAPYQEWGTGTKVQVPSDLQAYALRFKGSKAVIGIRPHPYFFVQKPLVENFLFGNITKILTREH